MLIDSHCHLDYTPLVQDRAGVLERARLAGVGRMVTISTKRTEYMGVRKIAEDHPEVYCSVGVHPHHVAESGEAISLDDLVREAEHPKVVGIGETGLDYFYDHAPRDVQAQVFRTHLQACVATDLPVIIHSREAEADTAKIIREESAGGKLRGVLHCFSSGRVLAEDALAEGFYVSFSGIITFKKSEELRAIARDIPMDRLLVETDSPYLAPEPYRGKKCEPAFVVETAKILATLKGVSFEEISQQTTANFLRLFNKVKGV